MQLVNHLYEVLPMSTTYIPAKTLPHTSTKMFLEKIFLKNTSALADHRMISDHQTVSPKIPKIEQKVCLSS